MRIRKWEDERNQTFWHREKQRKKFSRHSIHRFYLQSFKHKFFSFAENNIFLSCGYYVDSCLCEDVTKIETILDPYTQLYAMLGEMSHASGSDSRMNCRARFTVLARSGEGSDVDLCPTLAAFKQGGGPDRSHLAHHWHVRTGLVHFLIYLDAVLSKPVDKA